MNNSENFLPKRADTCTFWGDIRSLISLPRNLRQTAKERIRAHSWLHLAACMKKRRIMCARERKASAGG